MGFKEASIFIKVCLVVFPVALLLQIIAIATTYWAKYDTSLFLFHNGHWRSCTKLTGFDESCKNAEDLPNWWMACRSMGILGLLDIVGSIVMVILCIFLFTKEKLKIVYIINLSNAFAGAGFILISIIVFAAKLKMEDKYENYDLGWSYGLSVVAGLVTLAGGILLVVDLVKGPSSSVFAKE